MHWYDHSDNPANINYGSFVYKNVDNIKDELNILNGLIGQEDIEKEFGIPIINKRISVTPVATLVDALENPDNHKNLIVRVGGYSEYFNRLSPALKAAVLERNIHEV